MEIYDLYSSISLSKIKMSPYTFVRISQEIAVQNIYIYIYFTMGTGPWLVSPFNQSFGSGSLLWKTWIPAVLFLLYSHCFGKLGFLLYFCYLSCNCVGAIDRNSKRLGNRKEISVDHLQKGMLWNPVGLWSHMRDILECWCLTGTVLVQCCMFTFFLPTHLSHWNQPLFLPPNNRSINPYQAIYRITLSVHCFMV